MGLCRLQHLFGAHAVNRDSHGSDDRMLPRFEPVDFGDGYIEAVTQPVF